MIINIAEPTESPPNTGAWLSEVSWAKRPPMDSILFFI
jgi:hypothetical protein